MARSRSPSASRSRSPAKRRAPSADAAEPDETESGCPFLIRLFVTKGRHAPMIDFDEGRLPIRDEFQVYGWKTSTPTSLITLISPSLPPTYRSPLARFSFRHIYVDASARGLYRSNDLVTFSGRDLLSAAESAKSSRGMDMELDDTPDLGRKGRKIDEKTLDEYGFVTGDLLSVSLYIPEPRLPAGPNRPPPAIANGVPGGPGVGAPDRGGFGWDKTNGPPGLGREVHPSDKDATWARGEALPPTGRSIRGASSREPLGPRGSAGNGFGIRGAGRRRSGSPPDRGPRDDGPRRRSRSPDGRDRRDSYSRR